MARTLVTGATGFLGSRLTRALLGAGHSVRALVRSSSNRRRLDGLTVDYAEGDITDRPSVERALEGADRVFHCAALYEIGTPDPGRMREINVGGTANVLEAARTRGIPVVHTSSVAALGPTDDAPADEGHWTGDPPRSAYEATKREAHQLARQIGATIVMPVTIYGPDDPSLVGQVHRWFARGLLRVAAFAEMKMSLVHVDDCADGLIKVAERPRGEWILSGQVVTFREWFGTLARVSGRRPPRFVPDWLVDTFAPVGELLAPLAGFRRELVREGLAMSGKLHWAFSGERARRELGWTPRPLEQGLREVMAFYA